MVVFYSYVSLPVGIQVKVRDPPDAPTSYAPPTAACRRRPAEPANGAAGRWEVPGAQRWLTCDMGVGSCKTKSLPLF